MNSLTVYYRPDNYPRWITWRRFDNQFNLIGKAGAIGADGVPTARAGFAPRIPLGKPQNDSDPTTSRNLRRGFEFQVKFNGTGHVILDRFRIHAQTLRESSRSIQTP
jgi:hypothetical protein